MAADLVQPTARTHMKGKQPWSRPPGHHGKAYHGRSSQDMSTSLIMNFLLVHVGLHGPAEASCQPCISYCNTNPDPSAWVAHGPTAAIWEGSPTAGMGCLSGRTWGHGKGCCPPLCGPDRQQCNRKGSVCREVRIGQAARSRAQGDEMPKGTAAYRGKGSSKEQG